MGIDLATWRARIGLNYYYVSRPLQTRWRSSGGRLYRPGVSSWGVGEVMSDTPLVLKSCMTVVALSLILQYVVHSWSKVKGKGGGGKVRCHWRETTSQVRGTMDGGGILLLRAIVVVIPLLLVMAGDVERNPGPQELSLKALFNELRPVRASWYNIGLQLNVLYTTLDRFRELYSDPSDLLREMLKFWLKTAVDPPPTWETVVTALRSPSVNEKSVAAQLEAEYCLPVQHVMERTSLASPAVVTTARSSDSTTSPPPREGSQKLPFGCGCGKCTFFNFIESGCPTPIPSASSFPYLDLSGLTHEQQEELGERLRFESLQIMIRFQGLVSATIKSLKRRCVPLDELVSQVMTLGAFDPVFKEPQVPLFQYCFQRLESADTIPKIFLVLKDYFSFFNYHIIEYIIKALGTAEDKAKLQKYKEDFNQYAKRRIFECPPEFGPVSNIDHADIFVIVDSRYEDYTVAEIERFRHKLSEILHDSSQGILRLCRVVKFGFHASKKEASADKPQLGIDTSGPAESQRQFNKAMQYGHVEAWLSKMLLYGAAGSGKTCTNNMIAGNPPPENRHSTPAAVRPATVYRVSVEGKEWTKLTTQQERKSFLARMLFTFVPDLENRLRPSQQETQATFSSSNFSVLSEEPNHSVPKENSQRQSSSVGTDDRVAESKFEDKVHNSALESITTDKELVELMGKMSNTTDPLSSVRIIHIIDSGGQPQFHEILPIFIRQLSFYVFVFRLDIALDSRPEVELYVDGKQVGTSYTSAQTIEQLFQHCVRTMHSHGGSSSGCLPQIVVVGTHADKMNKSDLHKMLQQANQKLLKILLSSYLREQIIYSNPDLNEVVFPVNAADPGSLEEDTVKKICENVLGNKSIIKSTKIPLQWFGLEVLLEEMAKTQGVLSNKECLAAAKDKLFFEEDSFNAAIEYLDKLSVLFHYPDILPDLVFADPQLLLNKLTELIVKAYEIEKQPKALTAKWKYFREFARVDVEFLSQEEFSKHYIPNLFEPEHLVHLFKELFIFASISETELFVPCLLQSLDDGKVNEYRVRPYDSYPIPPLVIQFPEGCPRKGVFCSLICFLTSHKNYPSPWSILREQGVSSPVCLYRNCIQFKIHACPGTVTLIDAYTHFEVHVKVTPATSDKICQYMCQRIYNTILTGIHKASINLGYYKSTPPPALLRPTLALLCPCDMSDAHVAEVNKEASIWVCSIGNKSGELTPQQECWINCQMEKGDESVGPPSKRRKDDTADITGSDDSVAPHSMKQKHDKITSPSKIQKRNMADMNATANEPSPDPKNVICRGDKPTMRNLLKFPGKHGSINIPEQIGKEYTTFGTFLLKDDSGTIVPGIESAKTQNATEINRTILREWINGKGQEPFTWDSLVKCLRDADLNRLADDIEEVLIYDSSHIS